MPRPRTLVIATPLAVLATGVALFVPAYTQHAEVCALTGSRRGHLDWPLGIQTHRWHESTELERFILDRDPSRLRHDWQWYNRTDRTVIGVGVTTRYPGLLDDHALNLHMLDPWVAAHPDADVWTLYADLQTRDADTINQRISDALDWFASHP